MKPLINNDIWVFCDLRNRRLFDYSLKALSKACQLARESSGNSAAVIMAPPGGILHSYGDDAVCLESAVESSVRSGADYVYILENPLFATPRADLFSRPLCSFILEKVPALMLFALTDFGRELAAYCSMICDSGLIADCIDISFKNNRITGFCPAWGGEIISTITFSDNSRTGFATVHPSFQAEISQTPAKDATVRTVEADCAEEHRGVELLSSGPVTSSSKGLEDARRVVAGGAGLGTMENFALLHDLASVIGAQTGATRPPIVQHWTDEENLIGQTGKTIHPELLISVGTSGAVQYTGGISDAGIIVAINRDPDAPIFRIADIGIIADAPTLIPLITEKAKQLLMRRIADTLKDERIGSGRQTGFGEKIRALRQGHNWSPERLARATGQTPEFIRGVESGDTLAPVSFLVRLSGALGVDSGTFLKGDEKAAIKNRRVQAHVRRANTYSYEVLASGDENDHLRAFMVTIEPHDSHKPVEYKHEGEEFIFVMEGDLELTLDAKRFRMKKGEHIHFNSYIPHRLKNLSGSITKCLVVLYTV